MRIKDGKKQQLEKKIKLAHKTDRYYTFKFVFPETQCKKVIMFTLIFLYLYQVVLWWPRND